MANQGTERKEIRLGLCRILNAGPDWILEFGPVTVQNGRSPLVDVCGGSHRWWWGLGSSTVAANGGSTDVEAPR
jgi:hypothetical protein